MFQLETEIKKWRAALAAHESMGKSAVVELETHLRDLMVDLDKKGLNEQESFLVASLRLGKPCELVAEYDKVNPQSIWRVRMLWMLGGYVAFAVAGSIIGSLSSIAGSALSIAGIGPTWVGTGVLFVLAVAWSLLLYRVHWQTKRSTTATDQITAKICIWAILGYFLSRALSMIVAVPMYQLVDPKSAGQISIIRGIGGTFIHIAIFLACVALMWRLGRPPAEQNDQLITE